MKSGTETTDAQFFLALGFDMRAAGILTLFTAIVQSLYTVPVVPFGYSGILYSGALLIISGHVVQMIVWSVS